MWKTLIATLLSVAPVAMAFAQGAPPAPSYLTGTVTVVDSATITVAGVSIDTRGAKIITPADRTGSATLKSGDHVTVSFSPSRQPQSIVVDAAMTLRSAVESADSSSVTLFGRRFAITAQTVFGGYAGSRQLRSMSDVRAGDGVAVEAAGSGEVMRLWGLGAAPAPPRAKPISAPATLDGVVNQMTATSCTVGSTLVLLANQTKIDSGIAVGTNVTVVGLRAPDGSILANRITKR